MMKDGHCHIRIEGVPFCMVDHRIPLDVRPRGFRCGWRYDDLKLQPFFQLQTALAPLDVQVRDGMCPQDEGFFSPHPRAANLMVERCMMLISRVVPA